MQRCNADYIVHRHSCKQRDVSFVTYVCISPILFQILLLDEATAAIDSQTGKLNQIDSCFLTQWSILKIVFLSEESYSDCL